MALNLHIPILKEKPIIIADTRPQKISQSLANLQNQNPLDTASHLHIELEILNRQKVSASNRVQALDAYRPLLIQTALALAEDYNNAALSLHDKAKLAAAAAESLWLELGYGYKLALIDLQNQLIKLGSDKNSAHAIQRAMHALAEQALVNYQTYVTPADHIWSDLHQLYFCAIQLGIQNVKLASEKIGKESDSNFIVSIENTYKHALLMSLADPQHLAQKDMRLIAEFLAHHVADAQITMVTPLASTAGAFIISLKSNDPPTPYSKQKEAPQVDTDILLQTMGLVKIIHQHLNSLQSNQLPKDGSISSDASKADYIDLLTYLIRHWGVIPKRIFNRSQKNGELELVTGITAIHHISKIADGKSADVSWLNTLQINSVQMEVTRVKEAVASRWQVLNISASGMSIRRHPTAEKNIKIGSLLGIKTKEEPYWSLGIVRWASCGTRDRLDIGVQLIAPQAQPATVNFKERNVDEMVLLLPEIVAAKQAATIIVPKGTFEPARQLALLVNNQSKQILLTKLVERSHHFERIQYSVIN